MKILRNSDWVIGQMRSKVIFLMLFQTGGDVYIMKNILHAFDDEVCISLLENIGKAMERGTKLLIMEAVIEENNKPAYGKMFDLQMLIGTDGGKERTQKEFETILKNSGFNSEESDPDRFAVFDCGGC